MIVSKNTVRITYINNNNSIVIVNIYNKGNYELLAISNEKWDAKQFARLGT